MNDTATEPAPPQRSLRILRTTVLVLAIFLIAAVVIWILDGGGEGEGEEEAAVGAAAPRIVSAKELGEAAKSTDTPIFWAGERPGAELELSEAGGEAEGEEATRAYVRYLSGDAEAGDPKPEYLAIATYRLPGAYAALRANAKRTSAKLRKAPRGFRAWQDPQSPTSVYLARPGEDFQVEVYDPDPKTALEVALSRALQPIPTG